MNVYTVGADPDDESVKSLLDQMQIFFLGYGRGCSCYELCFSDEMGIAQVTHDYGEHVPWGIQVMVNKMRREARDARFLLKLRR